jgi:hypothetical protein
VKEEKYKITFYMLSDSGLILASELLLLQAFHQENYLNGIK